MTSDFTIISNAYMPLGEFVLTTLRQAILKGEIQPGERLMEIQLAEKMGVSRTPIREAIKKLSDEGLVNMIPRKGAIVAGISEKRMIDVLEVRTVLEKMAFECAFSHITEEHILKLQETVALMRDATDEGDVLRLAELDEQFHYIIYDAAGNDKLKEILFSLRESMYRYRREYGLDASSRETAHAEHIAIVQSLIEGDFESGMKVVEAHIENQKNVLLQKIHEDADMSHILRD